MTGAAGGGPSGIILLRKPEGETSFHALGPLKRRLGSSRLGHAGTLDRFARGLLVVLAGSCSRLADYVQAGEKAYRGLARFGAETDTLDPEGKVVAEAEPPTREALEAALPAFTGTIMQAPPAFSALHVGGTRAYELALAGRPPEMKPREVTIRSLNVLSYDGRDALLELRCSSGTYVRSLARDIALACGSRAHLIGLERLSIGPYRLDEAVDAREFDPDRDLRQMSRAEAVALGLGTATLPGRMTERFRNGARLDPKELAGRTEGLGASGARTAVFDEEGALLGIVGIRGSDLRYLVVLPSSERRA